MKLKQITIFLLAVYFSLTSRLALAEVREIQRAECTLVSGDVRASAEASVSRKLEGFCATDHLSLAFGNLEFRLLNEINHLRSMINMILPPLYQQHYFAQPKPQLYQPPLPMTMSAPAPASKQATTSMTDPIESSKYMDESQPESALDFPDQTQSENPLSVTPAMDMAYSRDVTTITSTDTTEPTSKQLKFRPVQKKSSERNKPLPRVKTGPREFEIHKLNNTILSGADLQIFTYYWKIEQFSKKLNSNITTTVNSPMFSIAGLYMNIKATFNHLNRDFLHLQLDQFAKDNDKEKSNIILKTGDMFKKIQSRESLKHTISILDQVTSTSDLTSQEFANASEGFLVPNSIVRSSQYSKGDTVLIKVVMILQTK